MCERLEWNNEENENESKSTTKTLQIHMVILNFAALSTNVYQSQNKVSDKIHIKFCSANTSQLFKAPKLKNTSCYIVPHLNSIKWSIKCVYVHVWFLIFLSFDFAKFSIYAQAKL